MLGLWRPFQIILQHETPFEVAHNRPKNTDFVKQADCEI
jgi:hypothetical protein